jgi:hypothetical protein
MSKKIGIPDEDPLKDCKKKIIEFMGHESCGICSDSDLTDLSSLAQYGIGDKGRFIVSPAMAAKNDSDRIYAAYTLRFLALVEKILDMKNKNICGEMTSIRLSWNCPKKESSDESFFLDSTVPQIIDLAMFLAESEITQLYLEKVPRENTLFGLIMFENNIAAELEINEALPDSVERTFFIKTNFTEGALTNMPLVGHFNEEGSIFATDEAADRLIIEDHEFAELNEREIAYWRMLEAIINENYPTGAQNSALILNALNESLASGKPYERKVK